MPIDYERLSRTISHALRHEPWLYELEQDDEGWVDLIDLLSALRCNRPFWSALSEADLTTMIGQSEKARYEVRRGRIRALYGHSLPGKLKKIRAEPPDCLFHGTSPAAIPEIKLGGLRPMGRQFVHLSSDRETATAVGERKAAVPAVLTVAARRGSAKGSIFYIGNDKVWLADHIPAEFIDFEDA